MPQRQKKIDTRTLACRIMDAALQNINKEVQLKKREYTQAWLDNSCMIYRSDIAVWNCQHCWRCGQCCHWAAKQLADGRVCAWYRTVFWSSRCCEWQQSHWSLHLDWAFCFHRTLIGFFSSSSLQIFTCRGARYMARTKQHRTYLPYTFPAVAGNHLPTAKEWRVE